MIIRVYRSLWMFSSPNLHSDLTHSSSSTVALQFLWSFKSLRFFFSFNSLKIPHFLSSQGNKIVSSSWDVSYHFNLNKFYLIFRINCIPLLSILLYHHIWSYYILDCQKSTNKSVILYLFVWLFDYLFSQFGNKPHKSKNHICSLTLEFPSEYHRALHIVVISLIFVE